MCKSLFNSSLILLLLTLISIQVSFSQVTQSDSLAFSESDRDLNIGILVRSGGQFNLDEELLKGSRTFELDAARIDLSGEVDDQLFYRIDLGFGSEMDSFEAYLGYKIRDLFQVKAGVIRPFVSREIERDISQLEVSRRAPHSEIMMNSREVGMAMSLRSKFLNFDFGVYNGNGGYSDNDRFFKYALRLISIFRILNTEFELGGVGSLNMTPYLGIGNTELTSSGMKYVYGGYFEVSGPIFLFKSEFLQSRFDVQNLGGKGEIINGLYTTIGAQITSRNQVISRADYLDFSVLNQTKKLATIGWNHKLSDRLLLMVNLHSHIDSDWNNQFGASFKTQLHL